MPERTLSDQIADFLIAQIFVGAFKPGDRLPPERRLAEILEVDRTSLRVALKILARMNLVESVQGSGATVLDMREHGGLDVLDSVLHIPDALGGCEQSLLPETICSTQLSPPRVVAVHRYNPALRQPG